jgi:hypothetical protein
MSGEIATYESQPVDVVRAPGEVLEEARKAATALATVVKGKKKPVIMNGEQYLEFEDWQTVAKFYGVSAKVISTEYIEFGEVRGFQARAVALNRYGMEISAAEAMCLNDEPNWKAKPLFQLRSMAQTRACAKSLRNVLAWVVVLAGYKPTPAEEMTGQEYGNGKYNGKHAEAGSTQSPAQAGTTREPQRKSTPKHEPEETKENNRDALHHELAAYCRMVDGETDMDMYRGVLAEVSRFEGKDKQGNPKFYEMSNVYAENVSDKWVGTTLRRLREKIAGNGNG